MLAYLLDTPVATILFLFTIATSIYGFYDQTLQSNFILNPYQVYRKKKVYTLITSGFIHADWMHLLFNMMTFYFFAFQLEKVIGSVNFAIVYVFSLILSDIPSVLKHKNNYWYHSLGASGAISGVLFSYILFFPWSKMMIFPLPIPIPAILFGGIYLAYCYFMAKRGQDGINHDAHFFGAIAGIMITILLVPNSLMIFLSAF